jgi:hypothetical protein
MRNTNRDKAVHTRLSRINARNNAITIRFNTLYQTERIRYDDCITMLASEYFLSETVITNVITRRKKE